MSAVDENTYGKYIVISNVSFSYGQEQIDRAKIPIRGVTKGKGTPMQYYRALTYKFIKKQDCWYLNVTGDVDVPACKTIQGNGYIEVLRKGAFQM